MYAIDIRRNLWKIKEAQNKEKILYRGGNYCSEELYCPRLLSNALAVNLNHCPGKDLTTSNTRLLMKITKTSTKLSWHHTHTTEDAKKSTSIAFIFKVSHHKIISTSTHIKIPRNANSFKQRWFEERCCTYRGLFHRPLQGNTHGTGPHNFFF